MWSEASIPDLTGRVALVTGGNAGMGFQTVKQLAIHGAKVYLGARSESRAKQAIDSILSENQSITKDRLVWLPLDLSNLSDIVEAAQLLSSWEKRLDILINNAGVAADDFTRTADGFELTIAVKRVTMPPATASTTGSDVRIVTISSVAEKFAPRHNTFATTKDLSDPGTADPNDYTSRKTVFSRYGASKLANLLFTRELQRRLDEEDANIMALAVDPGPVATDGGMGKGALTQLYCATAKEVANEPKNYKGRLLTAPGKTNTGSDRSRDSELARSLWRITEEALRIVGI
ncbi:uncharacterized protein TRIREDRAFT_104059 [Trichoderma reesei QM6a]|uniref:Predicted protein n=2 Tax=Hypocrea jecorina TaxID=51453 RepID=G0RB68_HYPJQ|nr:uncharacterized protein TRIREDRAFT_104059 [Trichoderma reesei QM6a]EGR51021.1 predicted protein [Trichoderma reesei QM6a]ETS04884.1 NAD(P)-binding protein [Trichoderma reesei RUT C-30]